jgi:hypothetical protein
MLWLWKMNSPVLRCHQKSPSLSGREASMKAKIRMYTSKVLLSAEFMGRDRGYCTRPEMKLPIRSMTPETPRSEDRTAKARATNRIVMSIDSVLRLIAIGSRLTRCFKMDWDDAWSNWKS